MTGQTGEMSATFEQSNLTRPQYLMWLGQQLNPDIPLYNMIYTFTISGSLNVSAFRRAFTALVDSTDIMRTVIRPSADGVPQQTVLETIGDRLQWLDLSEAVNPTAALERWVDTRRARPFDLADCLFDSALIRLSGNQHVWYFGQHHTVMDVRSSWLIFTWLSDLYQQALDGHITLPARTPYRDYVDYSRQIAQTPAFDTARQWWDEQLAQPVAPIDFYGKPSADLSFHAHRTSLDVGATRTERLRQLAQQAGIRSLSADLSLATVWTALMLTYLYRISTHDRLRVSLPIGNRPTAAFQDMAGLFLEVLSLTADIDPDETFLSLAKKILSQNMRVLQHTLPGISDAEQNRACDVLLNYINVSFGDFAGLPTQTRWIHSGYGDRNHKLRLQVHDLNETGHFQLDFDFNAGCFSGAQQQTTMTHFLRVIDAVLDNPTVRLRDIRLLSADEFQRLMVDFNATTRPVPAQTVLDMFAEHVAQSPSAVAVSADDVTWTYAELNQNANRIAHGLQAIGVQKGDRVMVCTDHRPETVSAIVGALKAGAVYVPVDPAYPDDRLNFIIQDAGITAILTDEPHIGRFADHPALNVTALDDTLPDTTPTISVTTHDPVYVIYTSGSTGQPKGVRVKHANLTNYVRWAARHYNDGATTYALYSSLAFDLTVTSIFAPLTTGGTVRVYAETAARGMVIRRVIEDNAVDVVKLTPSHLALVRDMDWSQTRIKHLIVGGEDFKTALASAIHARSGGRVTLWNEYGPTEATVAALLHRYQPAQDTRASVPIGTPGDNMRLYLLDAHGQPVPVGVIGRIWLAGAGVADGYLNRSELTAERFKDDPFVTGDRMYDSGDMGVWLASGQLEFLGRADDQVKVGGVRIELGEIESALIDIPAVKSAAVIVKTATSAPVDSAPVIHCMRCGIASTYPGITYDDAGVCNICRDFDRYQDQAAQYFKDMDELHALAEQIKANRRGDYDCIALLSGGKDSTYMLYRLVNMGLNVLAFTLDNGYISDTAKANIRRVTTALGVDHLYGQTPFMNEIFSDSLRRYANVCNGCFKTLYTLALNVAREQGIRVIVTGLSRGQFFETRLTPELFDTPDFDVNAIDDAIARARRAYHERDDIISRSLDVDVYRASALVDDITFIDFYRYCDVDLDEMYTLLEAGGLWERPADTGRSTNCLINDAGIWVHQRQRGFHNYALPYSWDVRLGHKTRSAAMAELDDQIDERDVRRMLAEIGYSEPVTPTDDGQGQLVAFVVIDTPDVTVDDLRESLAQSLPDYMVPARIAILPELPLTPNGKVDRDALQKIQIDSTGHTTAYVPPQDDLQAALADIWQNALNRDRIGIHDNFFDIGGHSLPAIRIVTAINRTYDITLPLETFFRQPTIAGLANAVEDRLLTEIENLSDEDIQRLLGEDDA